MPLVATPAMRHGPSVVLRSSGMRRVAGEAGACRMVAPAPSAPGSSHRCGTPVGSCCPDGSTSSHPEEVETDGVLGATPGRRGARAAESDSLLTSESRDSGTNRRTRKSPARHDSTGADSDGPENIDQDIDQEPSPLSLRAFTRTLSMFAQGGR